MKSWLIGKDPDAGKDWRQEEEGDDRGWDGWMASPTQWTWVWASSGSWWRTGKPGVLQSMGLQRVGLNAWTIATAIDIWCEGSFYWPIFCLFFGEVSVQVFCPFFNWVIDFLFVEFQVLVCFAKHPLADVSFVNIFSRSVACLLMVLRSVVFKPSARACVSEGASSPHQRMGVWIREGEAEGPTCSLPFPISSALIREIWLHCFYVRVSQEVHSLKRTLFLQLVWKTTKLKLKPQF